MGYVYKLIKGIAVLINISLVRIQAIAIALSPVFSFAVVPNTLSMHEGRNRTAAHNLATARREARYVRWVKEGKSGYETDTEESDLESTDV